MKKNYLLTIFAGILITFPIIVHANNNMTLPQVATEVQNVQSATNTSERGFIGNIIANIFQPAGRIKTIFLSPFQLTEDTSYNNTLPRWTKPNAITEGRFEAGTIRDNGSRIGVGVTPHSSATLRVNGVSLFDGLINANSGIGATDLNLLGSNSILFATNSNPRMTILSNGNVGIGTLTPTQRLDVAGSIVARDADGFRLRQSNYSVIQRNDNSNYWILLTNPGNTDGGWNSLRPFRIGLSSGDVTINGVFASNNQNVGIGTTSPSQRLDVNGKIRMRNQTTGGDAADTVATKGYVDSRTTTSDMTTVLGNWWRQCYYRDVGFLVNNWEGNHFCKKTANSHQLLCCLAR